MDTVRLLDASVLLDVTPDSAAAAGLAKAPVT
jgi:hypothetical protein